MTNQNTIQPKRIEENAKQMTIAGLSEDYLFSEPMDPSAQWQQLGPHLGNIPGQKEQVAYGVCFDLENGKGIEYLSGVEISDETKPSSLADSFLLRDLPSLPYAIFDHEGHASTIQKTCDAIWKEWFPGSGYQKPETANFFFERYGQGFDPQTGKGDIEIWIPVE